MVIELANAATFMAFCGLMYAEQVRYEGEGGGGGAESWKCVVFYTRGGVDEYEMM